MLRLPQFTYHRPKTPGEAVQVVAGCGPQAMYVGGGTDLYPNMKRRHQTPKHVVSLSGIESMTRISGEPATGMTIGAMVTLSQIEGCAALREGYPAVVHAVTEISTPLLRNMGTIGGNLLLDTRCTYYNQTHEWRESINFCMKEQGKICWVAPSSRHCLAIQSSDTVPLLSAMDAEVSLLSARGERRILVRDLYNDDGIQYLTKAPGELLTELHLPPINGWRASYRKLRRRGTFDFPVLGVGVCLHMDGDRVSDVRIRIGGVGSRAFPLPEAEDRLRGQKLSDDLIAEAAATAFKPSKAMDNSDHEASWRKKMTPVYVARALQDCRS